MCDTGVTLKLAANVLTQSGAKAVYAIVTHGARTLDVRPDHSGLLSGDAVDLIKTLPIEHLVVTNTIYQRETQRLCEPKLRTMDVSPMIAESIRRSHNGGASGAASAGADVSRERVAHLHRGQRTDIRAVAVGSAARLGIDCGLL